MRHYLFVNKYNSTLYKVENNDITKEKFRYKNEMLDMINNTAFLDIEKESYNLSPKVSPFTIGYEHYFSIDSVFGYQMELPMLIVSFLSDTFELIDNLNDIVIVFSFGAIGNNLNMQVLRNCLESIFSSTKIEVMIKDYIFMGTVTFLSLARRKSFSLVSGFNIISSIIEGNHLIRNGETIWVDKKLVLDNIKYNQELSGLKDDKEFQRVFDLTLDSRLNYGNPSLNYKTRDHLYKISTEILDEYIEMLKENIKNLINKDSFYLFDISFPLIYDEFVKNLNIDIDKSDEIIEYFKYVIEYSELILKYNTPYVRINNKRTRMYSLSDGYLEYDIEFLLKKKRKDIIKLFNTKYIKKESLKW